MGLRLAADRREYNPDSLLTWRYDWASNEAELDTLFQPGSLEIKRIRSSTPTLLALPTPLPVLKAGRIYQVSLAQLILAPSSAQDSTVLRPSDTLQLTLTLVNPESAKPPLSLVLTVNIVADPVQPTPEAAYGLLRQNPDRSVECVRFAWGLLPNRVDQINPTDLKTEVVWRRALFRWTDTVRPQGGIQYGIQKITQTGSTAYLAFPSQTSQ